jgi:hypothetical protein
LDFYRRFTLSLLTFVLIAGPRLVRADTGPSSAQASSDRAAAIDELQRGYQATGNPELLFKLAETYRQAGNPTAAARTYEAYLRRAARGAHRAAAEKALRELDTAPADGPSSPPPPVGSPPPAAATPPAGKPAPRATVVPASPVDTPLPPSEPAASPAPARHTEAPSPPAAGDSAAEPPAGVALSAPPPASTLPLPTWLPWAAAGATLAVTAGAIVFGAQASARYNQLRGSCGQTTQGCTAAQIDEVRSRAGTANILWVAAGVTAAVTGVTVFINTREAGVSALWRF